MSEISSTTLKNYLEKINTMKKNNVKFDKPKSLFDFLTEKEYKETSKRAFITSAVYYVKNLSKYSEAKKEKLIAKYNKESLKKKKQIDKEDKKGLLRGKEIENFVTWDKIEEVHKNYKDKNSKYFILLSLYVLRPPRRREYYNVYVYKKEPKVLNKEINYLIIPSKKTSRFIFNKYKTARKYGTQTLNNPDILDKVLRKYVKNQGIKDGDKLLDIPSSTRVSQILSSIFEKTLGKNVSVDILRHSYITYYMHKEKLSEGKLDERSYEMGHGVLEHLSYLRDYKEK